MRPVLASLLGAAAFVLASAPASAFHTVFDYRVARVEVDGNAFGPADGTPDLVDEFDDDDLAPSWHRLTGTAHEVDGTLHLTSPGSHFNVGRLVDVSEVETTTALPDGAGSFVATSAWVDLPEVGDFVHMTLLVRPSSEFFGITLERTEADGLFVAQHHGSGLDPAPAQTAPLDETELTGDVLLRIEFDDDANLATTAVSTDGGVTFRHPFTPQPVFGRTGEAVLLLGADPTAAVSGTSRCGNGVLEPGEQCDLGVENSYGGCCRQDCTLVDADGDLVCDPVDNCAVEPNPSQEDADGDGLGDACDACVASSEGQRRWRAPRVTLSRVNGHRAGDERLRIRGSFTLAADVDPMQNGALVQIRSLHGEPPIEMAVPPGGRSAGGGWKANRAGTRFLYKGGRRAGGVRRMVVRRRRNGEVVVSVLAPRGDFNFGPWAFPPLQAAVALGDTTESCGEVIFSPGECKFPASRRIDCR